MRLFGTAALVVAMAASRCAAQASEQAPIQLSRAETQNEPLHERRLNKRNKKKHNRKKHHHQKARTHTEGTPIPEEFVKESRQQQPSCSVCGEGMEVGNPDASVSFPGQSGLIPCGILQNMGIVGLIPPPQCDVLPSLISTICECEAIDIETTTTSTVPVSTTEAATKPSKVTGKSSKSAQLSISMPLPTKTGKSAADEPITAPSGGKSSKAVFSAPTSSGSMLVSSKAASKSSGKSEKSAAKSSKKTTSDAKAEKVTSSSKAGKAVVPKAGKSASY